MKVSFVSANLFGLGIVGEVLEVKGVDLKIITLAKSSRIKMYDGVPRQSWINFDAEVWFVNRLEAKHLSGSDLVIVAGWRQVLDDDCLKYPVIGFHPTLLPKGRGPGAIINTVLSGAKASGVTLFYLDKEIDHGDIVGQESFDLSERPNSWEVYKKATTAGQVLIRKYLPMAGNGCLPRNPQDHGAATYFSAPKETDNEELNRRAFSFPYEVGK